MSTEPGSPLPRAARATVGEISEAFLIDRIRSRLPPPPPWLAVGVGDDAAVIERERNRLDVVTTDVVVEGVHFDRRYFPAPAIGFKALAVNLSDLAAMGATPRWATLSLVLPPTLTLADFDGLLDGLLDLAGACRVSIVGGNIARSPGPLVIDVTASGTVRRRYVLKRDGARPGDDLWVSGTVGAAAAGLGVCSSGPPAGKGFDACVERFLRPEPRVRLGTLVGRSRSARACIDLSDGLSEGLKQLAAASGAGVTVEEASLPVSAESRAWFEKMGPDPVISALAGGEDYELLFAVSARQRRAFLAAAALSKVPVTRIGTVTRGDACLLRRLDGSQLPLPGGFAHFA
ncbi:MAG: thiamine-phosphate kinase [Vicinamibacterales bacterium]